MVEAKYLVGIDLGTSNCAMAWVELARGPDGPVVDFKIPQFIRPGQTGAMDLLPSCIHLRGEQEASMPGPGLPWDTSATIVVGELARWQGARVPGRLIISAKSWLCHPGVDREAPILPWGAPAEVSKLSPVQASAVLLGHMAGAWNSAHADSPLSSQDVVITVPASFDEVARALTVKAVREAGLESFTLLEEPQAAFYDFMARHRRDLGRRLERVRLVLVVDVGGGTSDFTLVQCGGSPEDPVLRRIAVGEHLMLGGDNMDAALSRVLEERVLGRGKRLGMAQWTQLTQAARVAKETLLSTSTGRASRGKSSTKRAEPEEYNLSIAAEGSRLIGSTLSARVTRAEAEQIVLDGFFPYCGADASPERSNRAALQEVGLPYAQDPAITRHLAGFLRAHAVTAQAALGQPVADGLPRPDAILLNGGVFNSASITRRLLEVVSSWWPQGEPIPLLSHDSLDLAVARGAAFSGLARRGLGRRIGGGSAHALFVGLEKAGAEQPMALCVVPRGQEEGQPIDLGERVFQLALGRPVRFPLYSTSGDRLEKSGEVTAVTEDLHELPPIHTLLTSAANKSGAVPVHLRARLTEIGTLELWCVANNSAERWRLEFELRGDTAESRVTITESMPAAFGEARDWIQRLFACKAAAAARGVPGAKGLLAKEVKQLWPSLERLLGPREEWRLPVLRELWSALYAQAGRRRRSAEHERIFFQLLGYTLRPGFGYPLDDWRCEQCAKLFSESVQFHSEKAVWREFWIFWRRIAGGLSTSRHNELWSFLKPFLALRVPPRPAKHGPKPKGTQPEGTDEMARLAAGLEHLAWQEKVEFGDWITARLRDPQLASGPWTWSLGRVGARAPLYGSIHQVVPPEKAAEWAKQLLHPSIARLEGALFALAQLARLTGDRTRDLEESGRAEVLEALQSSNSSPTWQRMVSEVVPLEAADKARALGDSLPVGLVIA